MNYRIYAILVMLPMFALARQDCLDNSWHLEKQFDNKEYHYVTECLCPCNETQENRNLCARCHHYHEAEPWVFISQDQLQQAPTQSSRYQKLDPREAISALIDRFRDDQTE